MSERILFTKNLPNEVLDELLPNWTADALDFVKKVARTDGEWLTNLPQVGGNWIVSSLFAAQLVVEKNLHGKFFVVGEKSRQYLEKSGRTVVLCGMNGSDLVDRICNHSSNQYTYLCSNIRRPEIKTGITKAGKEVQEIIVYDTHEVYHKLTESYDAYVFFSPSGVRAFFKENELPRNAQVFSIGSTTSLELHTFAQTLILQAPVPTLEGLISLIALHG